MSLSRSTTEKMRGGSAALFSPLWEKLLLVKQFFSHPTQSPSLAALAPEENIQRLQLENQLLSNELIQLHQLLSHQHSFKSQLQTLSDSLPYDARELSGEYEIASQRLARTLKLQIQVLPARVLFRSLDTWNSSLWINVGEADNQGRKEKIVAKDSPVLVGQAVVGVIDYVGQHQSRVRLITDPGLTPSVRAVRGGEQDLLVKEHIDALLGHLSRKKLKSLSPQDQEQLAELLEQFKQVLQPFKKSWYLAKGELQGSLQPSCRGHCFILKGTGFNYDFADEEGEGRDLRTGRPLGQSQGAAIPILKAQDILVTTGMDGIFPAGLKVAAVSKIGLLKEGDYFYELEAKPLAGPLHDLSLVFVIPPLGFNAEEAIQK